MGLLWEPGRQGLASRFLTSAGLQFLALSGRKMVSSWQARLPGSSLSNRVITQLPLPNLGSHHLLPRGPAAGWVLRRSYRRCFSAPLITPGPCPCPLLPSSTSHRHSAPGTFSLRFRVDGTEGGAGGRGGEEDTGLTVLRVGHRPGQSMSLL